MPDASVTFSGEAIPLLILFVPHQKPSRGGLWHPILMQFYSGPLMHLLSGVDRPGNSPAKLPKSASFRAQQQADSGGKRPNSLYFTLLPGNDENRDGFARDCLLQRRVRRSLGASAA